MNQKLVIHKNTLTEINKKELERILSQLHKPILNYEKDCQWKKRCSLDCARCCHIVKGINEV